MSFAKREMDRIETQNVIARTLLLEVGAFSECEDHGFFTDEGGDYDEAKKLGHARLQQKADGYSSFDDVDDLDEAIDRVVGNTGSDCPDCERIEAE